MNVAGNQTSSKQWNIPMLNARKNVQDKDTWGDVSSEYGVIKLQNIYGRLCLDKIETRSSYVSYNSKARIQHKAQ